VINKSKYVIKIITVLQKAHQIYIHMRKTPLWDGDGLGGQVCVAVDLAPQAQLVTSLERLRHTNLD
jgi:hypothetical protein